MTLNYNKFLDYVKKNGITLAKTTNDFLKIPKGTKLWFGLGGEFLSSYDSCVSCKNKEFGYKFGYSWSNCWENYYTGQFELVEDKKPLTNTIITNIKDVEQHKRVQEKLFEMGNYWNSDFYKQGEVRDENSLSEYGIDHIIIENGKLDRYSYTKTAIEENPTYKQITADEFLGENKKDKVYGIDVLINDSYHFIIPESNWLLYGNKTFNNINQPEIDMPKPIATGSKKIMSNIVNFFNDLTVSAEDKELRKAGLKNDELNYTSEAREIILNLEARERGYKSYANLREKIGYDCGSNPSITNLEMEALFKKFYNQLLETAKKFNKKEEKK